MTGNIYSNNNDCEKVAITDNYEINLIALYVSLYYYSVLLGQIMDLPNETNSINENELGNNLLYFALYI